MQATITPVRYATKLPHGCILDLDFNDVGAKIVDKSGFPHHGVQTSCLVISAPTGAGLDFDGSTSYINCGTALGAKIDQTGQFACEIVFRLDSLTNNVLPRIFNLRSSYLCFMGNPENLRYKQLAIEAYDSNGHPLECWGTTELAIGQWYHFVANFDFAAGLNRWCNMYLNGRTDPIETYVGGASFDGTVRTHAGYNLYVGRGSDLLRNLDGQIGLFRLFNRVLSKEESRCLFELSANKHGLAV